MPRQIRGRVVGLAGFTFASCALSLALARAALRARQPACRTGTGIVSLVATVVDSPKRLVPDLTKDDFQVLDNDKAQTISVFDNQVRPITVVVLLDTRLSMTGNLELVGRAAEQFLIRLLPNDQGKIGSFNDKIEIGAQFTDNRDDLVANLQNLDYGNGTVLYDAFVQGVSELHRVDGRRVIVVFIDGDDDGSRTGLGTVIDRARADEVMVYAIGFEGDYFDGVRMVRSKPDRGLQRLADET